MKKLLIISLLIFLSLGNLKAQWVVVSDTSMKWATQGFADNGTMLYSVIQGLGVYKSTNYGANWVLTGNGLSNLIFINNIVAKDSLVFVSSNYGLFRSTNYGNTFDSLTSVIGTVYIVYIINNFVYAGKMNGVFRSSDWGTSWLNINNEIPTYHSIVKSFAYSGGYLYAGIDSVSRIRIFKSSNYGNNWTFISQDITQNGIPYSMYAIENIVLCGTASGVYKSTNYGTNWALIPGINGNIGLFGFASSGTKNIFISAWDYGVFVSNDYGESFNLKNEGLLSFRCTALYKFGNYLFLGTNPTTLPCKIYRRPISEVIGIRNISTEIPNDFKIYQNYPNPFNPTTNIRYSIKRETSLHGGSSTNVKLIVYEIQGKVIETLVNEKQKPGTYEVSFEGSNLSSGIYFYRIQAGDFIQVKKMVLVK